MGAHRTPGTGGPTDEEGPMNTTQTRPGVVPGIDPALFPLVNVPSRLPDAVERRLLGSGCRLVGEAQGADVSVVSAGVPVDGLPTVVLVPADSTATAPTGPVRAVAADRRPFSILGQDAPEVGLDLLAGVDVGALRPTAALPAGADDQGLLARGAGPGA